MSGDILDLLPKIILHDSARGGGFCNNCKQYIHPDMIQSHKCNSLDKTAKVSKKG